MKASCCVRATLADAGVRSELSFVQTRPRAAGDCAHMLLSRTRYLCWANANANSGCLKLPCGSSSVFYSELFFPFNFISVTKKNPTQNRTVSEVHLIIYYYYYDDSHCCRSCKHQRSSARPLTRLHVIDSSPEFFFFLKFLAKSKKFDFSSFVYRDQKIPRGFKSLFFLNKCNK